ncbi:cohesin domain-containing protein [Chloroflexota bacterium]
MEFTKSALKKVCFAVALALGVLSLLAVILPGATLAQGGTGEVSLPDIEVMPGDTLTIDITVANINASMGLGAYEFTFRWDTAVIEITAIAGGDYPWTSAPTHNAAQFPTGEVSWGGVQTDEYPGLTTDQVVARLHATAVGAPSDSTVLDLEPCPLCGGVSLIDADGEPITATLTDGSVHIVPAAAAPRLTAGIDAGHYAVIRPGVERTFGPYTGTDIAVPGGIASYDATLTYNGTAINVMGVDGVAPFDSPAVNTDNPAGSTTLSQTQTGSAPQAPISFADVRIRLLGAADSPCDLTLSYTGITDGDTGSALSLDGAVVETLLRGDAKPDGTINIADALFVAQYLAGIREVGQGLDYCHPINAASIKHDGDNGDQITVGDRLFIAHYLAGIRDADFAYTG